MPIIRFARSMLGGNQLTQLTVNTFRGLANLQSLYVKAEWGVM
jgi:hypothetical protein